MSLIFRLFTLMSGHAGRLLSYFERRNPEALLETERESLRKHIAQFNSGLVAHAAVSERLTAEVKRGEAQSAEHSRRIAALVKTGQRAAAARYALELKDIETRLVEDKKQLEASETTYRQLVETRDRSIGDARRRLESVRRDIGDLKVKRAIASLEGMAQVMIDSATGPGASLERLQDIVTEEREKASARVRVMSGPADPEEQALRESERSALAEDALAEYLMRHPAAGPARQLPDYSGIPFEATDRSTSKTIKEGDRS